MFKAASNKQPFSDQKIHDLEIKEVRIKDSKG